MAQPARVSIAMATWNGERYLREQLQSFCDQTRQPDELVVCDDASTDSTIQILEDFAKRAPFAVHIHRNDTRLDFSRNFERAIMLCEGDVVFLSDQDDVWFATKIETVCAVLEANAQIQAVLNGQIITDAELSHNHVTSLDNLHALGMNADKLVGGCATALRKGWAALLFPIPATADQLLAEHLLTYDRWINELSIRLGVRAFIDTPLQFFRRHGANTSQSEHHNPEGSRTSEVLRGRVKYAPVHAWKQRLEVLELYAHWIDQRSVELEALQASVDKAVGKIEGEERSISSRIELVAKPLVRRVCAVAQLLAAGGYDYFNGWKSAVNDIVRPRARMAHRSEPGG